MNSLLSVDLLVEVICNLHMAAAIFLFIACWGAIPVTALVCGFRVSQLRDPRFDHRVTTPTHTALHFFFSFFFGLLLPSFYFMAVRQRWELGPWFLGRDTHSAWTIGLGVVCMAWLAAHLIEAALRLDRPRFGPSPVNRLMAGLGVGLCLWHIAHAAVALPQSPGIPEINIPHALWERVFIVIFFHVYPLGCYAAALAVFALALAETFRPQPMPARRRWRSAVPAALVIQAAIFAPFWLSIPKVTPGEALALLESHRGIIESTAQQADLDARLLAGIIYVAQTRDHPRLLGDPFERLGVRVWDTMAGRFVGGDFNLSPVDPSAGLCQMRPTTAIQILLLVEQVGMLHEVPRLGKVTSGTGGGTMAWEWQRVARAEWPDQNGMMRLSENLVRGRQVLPPLTARVANAAVIGDMEALLLEPESSASLAAIMLWTLREQWRTAGHPIDGRPEILATLYNIGFERSEPKAEPRANDFGRRVREFMESEECAALFPPREEVQP